MAVQVYVIGTTQYGNLIDVTFDGNTYELSDHNRLPISIATERIEMSRRTAKGTRRRYHIADKISFSVNWTKLPGKTSRTVDGKLGADALEDMYQLPLATDEVVVTLANQDGTTTDYTMHITSFNKSYLERFTDDYYYEVSMSFEEV